MSDDYKLYNHFEQKFKQAVERCVVLMSPQKEVKFTLTLNVSYGREELESDVARLQELNKQLREDCVLDIGDNSKLSGEFK